MKIDGINRVNAIYSKATIQKTPSVTKKNRKDHVEFSSVAKDFKIAKDAGNKVSDVRFEKVQDIKQRIASGNYNVNGQEVAKKMIDSGFDYKV